MKLAVALLAWLAVSGVLATVVPQGKEASAYAALYGRLLGEIIVQTGFSRFFTSILFLLPSLAFFANLSACTIDRFLRELRKRGRKRHGPDILHIGLMLLVVGAVLTFSGKQQGSVSLAVGDKVELPESRVLELLDFSYEAYADGRPKSWTSTVRVTKDGTVEHDRYDLRVNHPLKLGGLTLYQFSHSARRVLAFTDAAGVDRTLRQGEEHAEGEHSLFFMAPDDGSGRAVLRITSGGEARVIRAGPGDTAGPFVVAGLRNADVTGLQAVVDPGYPFILASLVLVVAGLCLTFIQKLGDMRP